MSDIWHGATADILAKAKFRGPVRYADGRNGMAQQDYECVDNPRFGYAWRRDNRKDKGCVFYTVDGVEMPDLETAARHLQSEPNPDSPREVLRRFMSETPAERQARHAQMDAEQFMRDGPFGMLMASYARSENAWHNGINRYSDILRKRGAPHPSWLYATKSSVFEMSRLTKLFAADRKADTGLKCAMGNACRGCEILKTIEATMEERRTEPMGMLPPRDIDDSDIDAAKALTCIGHVLTHRSDIHVAEGIVWTKEDREDRRWG